MSVANASGVKTNELEREVEESRDQVSHTLEELQSHVSGTIDEWKHRLTPEEISREVKTYVADSGRRMVSNVTQGLETRLRENPASVVAMGAIAAWPLYKIARKIPLPVYLMGAGVVLMKPMGRAWEHGWDAFADLRPPKRMPANYGDDVDVALRARGETDSVAAGIRQQVNRGVEQVTDTASRAKAAAAATVSDATTAVGHARTAVTSTARDAATAVTSAAHDAAASVTSAAHDAAAAVTSAAHGAYDAAEGYASDLPRQARRAANRAGRASRQAAGNPFVLGLVGLAGVAAVTAALPRGTVRRGRQAAANAAAGTVAGARAAIERAYNVAVEEALASGASLKDAEETARAFVARMTPRRGRPHENPERD